ncbi:hypothetical protein [Aeoliella mucimassa]|uniref:Uncharacterized protein n=1 Tax=Aeoliella mucimassa TaxID=2527972 RepID=A0A518AUC4_9BACT|nr:hypothetical protein [Aeoliella mucimassa]QDU58312.1 hypothetical protein Pan181_45450 [Aeoliella mucimassa]
MHRLCLLALSLLALSLFAATSLVGNTVAAQPERSGPRTFAPGVITTIEPEILSEETYSRKPMIEITANQALDWDPATIAKTRTLYSQAKQTTFTNEVWGLEFSFKPLRMVTVEVPNAQGESERKLLWYLVYNVRNTGERLKAVEKELGEFTAEPAEPKPVRFLPHFVLEGQDRDTNGQKIYKAYLDRIIPGVVETIRQREVPGRELLNNAEMAATPIEVSTEAEDHTVWGVAIWEQVDPEMDFLSIYVSGLTNAYVWADPEGEYQAGDPAGKGRRIAAKTLQLNFWRPGDEFLENEKEIRFGVPDGKADLYGVDEGVAYQWTFR